MLFAPAFVLALFVQACLADSTGEMCQPRGQTIAPVRETVTVAAEPQRRELGVSSETRLEGTTLVALRGVVADDAVRSMQALPGSATGDDFQAEFSVRGAPLRHLGLVVDGVPARELFHAVHAVENTGSVAMINRDALDAATLVAGPHPRRDGDWLGATIELDTRDGSRERTIARGAISGTSASILAEGPLGGSQRGSWLVAGRRNYLGWLVSKLEPDFDSAIGNADGHLKLAYDLTGRQRVQLLVVGGDGSYRARDVTSANGLWRGTSGSTLASTQWEYGRASWRVAQRVSFVGSQFRNLGPQGQELARGYSQAVSWRADGHTTLSPAWSLSGGVLTEQRRMSQTLRRFRRSPAGNVERSQELGRSAAVTLRSGWAELGRRSDAGGMSVGVRASGRTDAASHAFAPWLSAERRVGSSVIVRTSAGQSAQFPDPAADLSPRPLELERARAIEIGLEHELSDGVSWRMSAFGRRDMNLLRRIGEYRFDPVLRVLNQDTTFPIYASSLVGTTRGVDLVLTRGRAAGLHGWIAYTWARTRLRDRVTGESFDGDHDQRHTLNVVAMQPLSARAAINAVLRIGSNVPLAGYFEGSPEQLRLASERNRVRLPLYARLDVRMTRTFEAHDRQLTLVVEILNVLRRRNLGQADGAIFDTLDAPGHVERMVPFVPSAGLVIAF